MIVPQRTKAREGAPSEQSEGAGAPRGPNEYLGTALPSGMTVGCCKELVGLFNERADPYCELTNRDLAILAFEAVRRLRS